MHKGNLDFVNGKLAAPTLFSVALAASPPPSRERTAVKCWIEPIHFNSLFFWGKKRERSN